MPTLLIRGAAVLDGTGAPAAHRDVLVDGGRIEALLRPGTPVESARVLAADGLVAAPGFIDVHTHSDVSVLLDGRAQSKVHQGVTTDIVGNCGFSAFPLTARHHRDHVELLAGIGDDPVSPHWRDLAGYGAALAERGTAINVAALVGHGQLRIAAAGMDQRLSPGQLATQGVLLAEQLDQGAFGLSTGLTYVPSRYADDAELTALCRVLARYGRLYATHARGGGAGAIEEAARLGHDTGARIQFSHLAVNEPDRWGRAGDLLAVIDRARGHGVDLAADVYPYDASASALTQYLPAWVQDGGIEAMRARLADPAVAARAEADLAAGWGGVPGDERIPWFWDRVLLARTDGILGAPEGATVEQAARAAGLPPARYVLGLCRAGGNRVQVVLFYRSEADMREFLRYTHTLVGSDGAALPYDQGGRRPHPRAFGAHARVLGRYVRELGDLDLATAVHRMTGAVADRLGIADRGVLRPGLAADVVVFDPAVVADRATFLDPCRPPAGIHHVLVNGEPVIENGAQTSARPGRLLRAG
ncbi:N-acyl-D-amino-acid deacylase family protein [Jiangella gansuensis]|uniref:N-acyl-D-amino-acid deacylase family protein n=1 Tax=Jiangella gansuensis TaxID=281473 RepID=UPI00047D9EF9|nr:D-aminoacylase [Jiangella gansuensis]